MCGFNWLPFRKTLLMAASVWMLAMEPILCLDMFPSRLPRQFLSALLHSFSFSDAFASPRPLFANVCACSWALYLQLSPTCRSVSVPCLIVAYLFFFSIILIFLHEYYTYTWAPVTSFRLLDAGGGGPAHHHYTSPTSSSISITCTRRRPAPSALRQASVSSTPAAVDQPVITTSPTSSCVRLHPVHSVLAPGMAGIGRLVLFPLSRFGGRGGLSLGFRFHPFCSPAGCAVRWMEFDH